MFDAEADGVAAPDATPGGGGGSGALGREGKVVLDCVKNTHFFFSFACFSLFRL